NVEAEHGVFAGETLFLAPRSRFAQFKMDFRLRGAPAEKQTVLAGFPGARGTLQRGNGVVHGGKHGLPRPKRIHGTGLDEAFKDALIQKAGFDAFAEIVERLELTLA